MLRLDLEECFFFGVETSGEVINELAREGPLWRKEDRGNAQVVGPDNRVSRCKNSTYSAV